jgi:hypothetical protein
VALLVWYRVVGVRIRIGIHVKLAH